MNGITVLIKGTLQTPLTLRLWEGTERRPSVNQEECPHWRLDLPVLDFRQALLFISYQSIIFCSSRLDGVRQLLWSESQPDKNTFHQTVAKANWVLPRECTGHSKHPLPTEEDSTHGHHQMVNTEIRLIIFFAAKDGEALFSQQKQDQELTVAQIMYSLLPNSDLNWKKWGKPLDHAGMT